ncbi:S8 family serine peptidase [bacterium]|nr:S8 family serine peptidase [bacterium]
MTTRRPFGFALSLGLVLTGCQVMSPLANSQSPTLDAPSLSATVEDRYPGSSNASDPVSGAGTSAQAADVVPGELIVTLAPGAALPLDWGSLGKATVKDQLRFAHRVALLALPDGVAVEQGLTYLRQQPGVITALPNHRIARREAPPANDPLLGAQWSYPAKVANVYGGWTKLDGLLDPAAIARTTVAVLDTGVDPDHPDLNVLPGYNSADPIEGGLVSTASFDPAENDHGTACAGVLGARRGNGLGAAGVAPGVPILPIKVIGTNGGGSDFSILRGLKIAADYNRPDAQYPNLQNPAAGKVRVVNLSYGPTITARLEVYDAVLEELRQQGIVVCVAAGNNGGDGRVEVPANSPAAIGVSCTFQYLDWEMLAPYSSRGPEIWVSAPGNYLWSTAAKGHAPDYANAYRLFNGTSAAAPFAAGVAALVNIVYGSNGPDQETAAWADRVKRRLAESADDLGAEGFDPFYGHGRVNAERAVSGSLPN